MRSTRIKEIERLENCERQLCRNLGRKPKGVYTTPLPSEKTLTAYETYLEELEREKFVRREKFCLKKYEIIDFVNELGIQVFDDFEKTVIQEEDDQFLVTDENMRKLGELYDDLLHRLAEEKEEIESLSKKIERLWNVLEVDIKDRDTFCKKCSDAENLMERKKVLKDELKRCEALKKKNIQLLIEKLRGKLLQLWDKMHYTQQQRDEFEFFNSDVYTEDLLEFFERQLVALETKYEKNSEIYLLLEKHKDLITKMKKLEKGEEHPDRYKNRGGQLLKEEKERIKLQKQLTSVESKLKTLSKQYYNGKQILVYGKTIENYIDDLNEAEKIEKQLRMTAKKQQREQALTPGKSGLYLPSVSTLRTPLNSTSKRKNATPLLNTDKKMRLALFRENKGTRTAPAGKATVKTMGRVRTSLERVKKLNKRRSKNVEYSVFENDLENLDPNKRSTTVLNIDDDELARPLATAKVKPKMVLTTPRDAMKNLKI